MEDFWGAYAQLAHGLQQFFNRLLGRYEFDCYHKFFPPRHRKECAKYVVRVSDQRNEVFAARAVLASEPVLHRLLVRPGPGRDDPDPTSAGTARDAGRWAGSIAAVGMAANPLGAH